MSVLTIERDYEGVYFVEYSKTIGVERFRNSREVREFLRKIPDGRLLSMANNLPVFSGFENHREIENSFRALYNSRVREALLALGTRRAGTRTPEGGEYYLDST